ncbi:UNVERIFIED_CONTAM: hypothetical protein K2H54_034464 [Gekko kuhli]
MTPPDMMSGIRTVNTSIITETTFEIGVKNGNTVTADPGSTDGLDLDRDEKEELPKATDPQPDEATFGKLGIDGLEVEPEGKEKGRERDQDRDREGVQWHSQHDKDRDQDREHRRDRDRDRDRDREHKHERDERGGEKWEERRQGNGMEEALEETSQDMFPDQESVQSVDSYLSTENEYMMETVPSGVMNGDTSFSHAVQPGEALLPRQPLASEAPPASGN